MGHLRPPTQSEVRSQEVAIVSCLVWCFGIVTNQFYSVPNSLVLSALFSLLKLTIKVWSELSCSESFLHRDHRTSFESTVEKREKGEGPALVRRVVLYSRTDKGIYEECFWRETKLCALNPAKQAKPLSYLSLSLTFQQKDHDQLFRDLIIPL
jgi:hypothetical protein